MILELLKYILKNPYLSLTMLINETELITYYSFSITVLLEEITESLSNDLSSGLDIYQPREHEKVALTHDIIGRQLSWVS